MIALAASPSMDRTIISQMITGGHHRSGGGEELSMLPDISKGIENA
jgi:hypothetical protein